ncbi:FG-GAP repeat domain-containing protein [Streptomyces sp. NPDC056361]|uniref:FG-GAP repeat domain-containing protein n=1 Tax=Streptomyces sp. NPDC056361 TaxID=3345795 RepID=UPI0035D5BCA2
MTSMTTAAGTSPAAARPTRVLRGLKALALGLTALALGVAGTTGTATPAAAGSLSPGGASFTGDASAELVKKEGDSFRIWQNVDGDDRVWPWSGDSAVNGSGWSGVDPAKVYFADLNDDGYKDLVQLDGDSFRVWYHNGTATFGANPWTGLPFRTGGGWSGHDPSAIWFADVDGDGRADLIDRNGDELRYFPNLGSGNSWGSAVTIGYGYGGHDPRAIWFADLNGDRRAERIEKFGDSFLVAPNTTGGNGGWPWGTAYFTGSGWSGQDPAGVWFADLTGDNRADLVQKTGDALRYFPNNGSGSGHTNWAAAVGAGAGWSAVDPKGIYFA